MDFGRNKERTDASFILSVANPPNIKGKNNKGRNRFNLSFLISAPNNRGLYHI